MVSGKIVVLNEKGLHLRNATKLCEEALKYPCLIQIKSERAILNAKSVLGVLGACVRYQDEIEIICDGDQEQEALEGVLGVIRAGNNQK